MSRAGINRRTRSRSIWRFSRLGAKVHLERHILRRSADARIVAIAWPRDGGGFPDVLWSEVIPYVSDCWPDDYDRWTAKLQRMKPRHIFVSARDAAAVLQQRLPRAAVHWLPEAIDPRQWDGSRPLAERSLDVLELGRHHTDYHNQIRGALGPDVTHRFASDGSRTPIFPGFAALRAGLADSKIQVCFPKSMTHPDQAPDRGAGAKGLETVTQRYFEAIASGSVIVGHSPAELTDLFGYDPTIPADLERPVEQLHALLDDIESCQDLVHRNLARLHEVGTWDVRVTKMLRILGQDGYEVPK